jgi:AAA domain
MVLPADALTFRREWAALIPQGATVALAHDADRYGDQGADKAAKIIGGRTVRLRPPLEGGDWCDWSGDRAALLELLAAARSTLAARGLTAIRASHVTMRSIEWKLKPLWQSSAFELLAGPKGAGKGTYLAWFGASVNQTANVLFIATEDSAAIDLVPRLTAAGANLDNVHIIEQHIQLPGDVDAIETLALELGGVGLLVIDPVANHIGQQFQ